MRANVNRPLLRRKRGGGFDQGARVVSCLACQRQLSVEVVPPVPGFVLRLRIFRQGARKAPPASGLAISISITIIIIIIVLV